MTTLQNERPTWPRVLPPDHPLSSELRQLEVTGHSWVIQPGERCVVVDGRHSPREFVYEGRNNLGHPVYRDPLDGGSYPQAVGEVVLPAPKSDPWFASDDLVRELLAWDQPNAAVAPGDPGDVADIRTSADNMRLLSALAFRIACQQEARYVEQLECPALSLAWGAVDEDGEKYAATADDGSILMVSIDSGERWDWVVYAAVDFRVVDVSGTEVGKEQAMAAAEAALSEGANL